MTATRRIRVLLVDDHAVVREGYKILLRGAADIEVAAEADTGEAACQRFAESAPDVVVMDLALPGMGGLEAIGRIVARDPTAKVLVFSMYDDPLFVERALANGARGYITKRSAPEDLVDAVRQVAAGGTHLDSELERRLAAGGPIGRACGATAGRARADRAARAGGGARGRGGAPP